MDDNPKNEVNVTDEPPQIPDEIPNNEPLVFQTEYKPPTEQPIVVVPVIQPVAEEKHNVNNPGLIVLQWLTYAFWGGTVIAVSILSTITLVYYILGTNAGEAIVYAVAATLVLLPISVICDIFYTKHEPEKKTGAASVIMAIHAVIFALIGIGSLVTIVMSLVTIMISSSDLKGTMVALYSAIIVTVLLAALFLRTLLSKKLFGMRRYFVIFMVVVVGVICGFAIFGPVADTRLTRNDRLIETNLPDVASAVNGYASANNRLPDTLSALDLTGDTKKLVTDNLVIYKKDTTPDLLTAYSYSTSTMYYQLCVTYKKASTTQYPDETLTDSSGDYSPYASTYSHPAGEKCYKLETSSYSRMPQIDSIKSN